MSTPEIWVREGRPPTIEPLANRRGAYLRLTDLKGEVTIRYWLSTKDLRSLRRWLNKVVK